jgi:hypothetical protein
LQGLIEKIIGPLSTEDFGLADLMAAKDKPAVYQAAALIRRFRFEACFTQDM